MAQKTYTEMVTAVTDNCKRTDNPTVIQRKIQDAIKLILNRGNFPQLEDIDIVTTTASQAYTALPTLFKGLYDRDSVTSGVSGDIQALRILSPGEFITRHPKPDEDTEAMPTECMLFEDVIQWYPIPDDTYDIRLHFFKYHADFDTDTPHVLGEQADRAIECIATAMVYESFQEYADAGYWYGLGFDDLKRYLSKLDGRDGIVTARPPQIYSGVKRVTTADRTDYGRVK